jgi:hypothetical protein
MEQVYIGTTNYGRHWLAAPAAASWQRMVRDGCPPEGITDAGRTEGEQIAVFLKYFTTDYATSAKFDRRVWQGQQYWRRPGKPSAATPNSPQARHQKGLSLDLNGATKAWVRANGHRYGWIKDLVPGEDWHMEYQASRDVVLINNPGNSTGGTLPNPGVNPITPITPKWEDDMALSEEGLAQIKKQAHDALVGVMRSEEFRNIVRDAILETTLGQGVGKVRNALEDTRVISRRTEQAVASLREES